MDAEPQPQPEPESRTKTRVRASKKLVVKKLNLNIPEKLFILTVDDEKGMIAGTSKISLQFGLGGALLAELALAGKIQLVDGRLVMTNPAPTGESLFDDVLIALAVEEKPRKLRRWVDALGRKQLIKEIAARLAERQVITVEKKLYLWVIPYEVYPQVDASAKYWVKQRLRAIVLAGEAAEAADIALLSLLKACNMSRLVFTRDERKYANKKVDSLVQGEVFGEAVASLLADIEAAAAAAAASATSG